MYADDAQLLYSVWPCFSPLAGLNHCTLHTRHCKELEARKKKKLKKCDDITEVLPLKCMPSSTVSTFSGVNIFPRLSGVLLLWTTLAASLSLHWLQYWNQYYCAGNVKAHVCFVFLPFPLHHLVDLHVDKLWMTHNATPILFSEDEKQTMLHPYSLSYAGYWFELRLIILLTQYQLHYQCVQATDALSWIRFLCAMHQERENLL